MIDEPSSIDVPRRVAVDAGIDRRLLAATLRNVAAGDRMAFEELYRRTAAKLFGVCLRILSTRAQAEEALQDAYLTIWQQAGAYEEARGTAMTWLIALTRNRAIDRLRAGGKLAAAPIEDASAIADDRPDAFDILEADGEARRLADCLRTLAEGDARFIRSTFLQGSTYADLAGTAGLPLGTVKSRIRRALLKLRSCLQ